MFPLRKALSPPEWQSAIIRDPLLVAPDTPVITAIAGMGGNPSPCPDPIPANQQRQDRDACFSCALVVENEQVVGIFTERDVVRLNAQQQPFDRRVMRQVMTHPVVTLRQSALTDGSTVLHLLQQHRIRHLPILDDQDQLVGLLTQETVQRAISIQFQAALAERQRAEANPPPLASQLQENIAQLEVANCELQQALEEVATRGAELKESSLQLEEERLRYQDLFNFAPDGYLVTDAAGRVQEANQRVLAQLGVSQCFLIGKPLIVFVAPSDYDWFYTQLNRLLTQRQTQTWEMRLTTRQGNFLPVEVTVAPIHAPAERVIGLRWLIRDISERSRLEAERKQVELERSQALQALERLNAELEDRVAQRTAELQARETYYRALLDGASDMILLTNPQGRILSGNRKAEELLGYTCAELTGMTVPQLHPPEDLPREIAAFEALVRQQLTHVLNMNFRCKDGRILPMDVTVAVFEINGETVIQGIFRDIRDRVRLETERKQAEAALQQENAFRQQIVENMAEGLGVCHAVETFPFVCFTIWNRQMEVITGYTIEEINRLGWYQSLYPDPERQAAAIARMDRMRQGENLVAEGWQIQPREGQPRTIEISTTTIVGEAGQIHVLALIQDITDRKRAELERQELLQELSAFKRAINQAAIVAITDTQGVITVANDRFCEISGYSREELIGQTHHLVNSAYHPPQFFQNLWRTITHGQVWRDEICNRAKDGSLYWVDTIIAPLLNDQGRPVQYLAIRFDISDRKQAEVELQKSRAYYQGIIADQTELICRFLPDGTLTFVNDTYCKFFQKLPEELLGHSFTPLLPEEDADIPGQHFSQLSIDKPVVTYEHRVIAPDGTLHWQQWSDRALFDANGEFIEFQAVGRNITALKEAEAQLQQTNAELLRATRMKDEFLANMSHELRTPLNAILGMTEGLQEKVFGELNARQLKTLQTVERSGTHLLELINDILDVAKIESGQFELHCTQTTVSLLCQSSLTFIRQQALKKQIQLEIQLPATLPDIVVDERRLRQVLINLLNNAVKFTPEGGHITLEASLLPGEGEQNTIRFAVIDTGIGIAPEHRNKLFKPFMQIDSALNRQYSGTGLGLALVKRIVELHGGQVGLTSEVGVGSCFTLDLPGVIAPDTAINPAPASEMGSHPVQSAPASPPLILLAEDNEANIATIASYLEAKGYRMVLANNGEAAIALAQSDHPHLILMDIQMPGMDGLDAIQQIRANPALVQIPIIALTALVMEGDRDRCLAAGANEYLSKPVKLKQLATLIQQLLL